MNEASDGQTYEEVSGQYIGLSDADKASPDGQALGQLRQTLFMGNTLRGLLLYGYAFATIGTIAGIAAYRLVRRGGLLLLLALRLGFWHARRAGQTAERAVPQEPCPAGLSPLSSPGTREGPGRSVCAERHRGRGDMSVRGHLWFAALVAALLVSA